MASLIPTVLSTTPPLSAATPTSVTFRPSAVPSYRGIHFSLKTRGLTVMTRAGPSTSSYVFAFVLPLSLLVITIFTSIKVADRLDRQFLEEQLILNEAMKEEDEDEDEDEDDNEEDYEDDDFEVFGEDKLQEPVISRIRNRPKKEV